MALDLSTLFVVTTFTSTTAGGLLLLSWTQHREVTALAYWGAGFLIAAPATALITHQSVVGEFWSVTIGHVLLAIAYGVVWHGVRIFNHRPASWWLSLAGAGVWIAATQIDAFYASLQARTALMAAIVISYSSLAAVDFWHARHEGLVSRWPVIVILVLHAIIFLTRIPLAGLVQMPDQITRLEIDWLTFLVLETILHAFCVAYLFGSMARERVVLWYKNASLTDPLTGIANRRAFMHQGEKLLDRARYDGTPIALLALDLDRFKEINDRYGHPVGDDVLIAFSRMVAAALRPTDLLGRLGGEEFACLLPDTSADNAVLVAERLRNACSQLTHRAGGQSFATSVSIGLAMADGGDLAALLARADRALYRAKTNGRNRVEIADLWTEAPPLQHASADDEDDAKTEARRILAQARR